MRRFELSEGKSHKFWSVERVGTTMRVTFGRIGTTGQTQEKSFATETAAQAETDKLVKEKVKKGYREVDGGESAPAARPVAAVPAPAPAKAKKAPAAPAPAETSPATPAAPAAPRPAAPPTSVGDGEIAWTPGALREASPIRGSALVARRPADPKARHAKLARLMASFAPQLDRGHNLKEGDKAATKAARLAFAEGPMPETLDVESQAGAYALLATWASHPDDGRAEELVRYWVEREGASFAMRALARASELDHAPLSSPWLGNRSQDSWAILKTPRKLGDVWRARYVQVDPEWRVLREAVACASDEEHAKLLAEAETLRKTAIVEIRADLAAAFERPDWVASDVGGLQATPKWAWPLLVSAKTIDEGKALLGSAQAQSYVLGAAVDELKYDLLARYGVSAAPYLMEVIALCTSSGTDRLRSLGEALALVVDREVAAFFAKQLGAKELRGVASTYLKAHPEVAFAPLAQVAAGKGALADTARGVLKPVVVALADRLESLSGDLGPAAARVVQELAEQSRPREEAAPAELPRVLRAPPWLEKRKLEAPMVLALEPLAFVDTMAWKAGEREARVSSAGRWLEEKPDSVSQALDTIRTASASKPAPSERSWNMTNAAIFAALPKEPLLAILPEVDLSRFSFAYHGVIELLVARHGTDAIDFALRCADIESVAAVEALSRARSARVAPLMADAFVRLKKAKATAAEWLVAYPDAAATGLLPHALGKPGKARANAETALRFVAARGQRAALEAVAARFGPEAEKGLAAVLAFDPLLTFPAKLPKIPTYVAPEALSRPLLRSGKALPPSAIEALVTMLAFTSHDEPYPGIAEVKAACDPGSLADFAWDLFQAWLLAGGPSKEGWAFLALGLLGDDESARRLTPLVRAWPGEAAHARAVTGLDVLARIGTDVALMHLHGISQKLKFQGLKEKAREKIDQIAEARGLTGEELADRLVPDLDLDEDGARTLDFGPRTFRVVFDEALKPGVTDESGKRLPDLPKPKATDDAEKSKEAVEVWKALKKDAKTIASAQLLRLELAMCSERRWSAEVFRQFLLEHPLMVHVVRRVVWGVFDEEDQLTATFRVAEDRSLADQKDDAFDLADGARVGIVHRLALTDEAAAAWGQVFADYEVVQPFAQLSREIAPRTDAEAAEKKLARVVGLKVPTGKVLGLDHRGWRRGPPEDAGVVGWYEKPIAGDLLVSLELNPGIFTGIVSEAPEQTLGLVTLSRGEHRAYDDAKHLTFAALSPVAWSELLRDLDSLRA